MKKNGFTLIELMIIVAIIGILAAVSVPAYIHQIRRAYLNDAVSSLSAIKSAEESYFAINNCYIAAPPHPTAIPAGTQANWDTGLTAPFNPETKIAWSRNGLGVRPDANVRFQFEVFASNAVNTATGGCGAGGQARPTTAQMHGTGLTLTNCNVNANQLAPATVFPTNWYIVVARGDLDGDTAGGGTNDVTSLLVTAIDNSAIIKCNEIE